MTTPCRHKGPKVVDGKVIRCVHCGKSVGIVSVQRTTNDIRAEAQMTKNLTPEEIAEMSEDCQCSCKELEQMTAQRDHWLEIVREKDAEIERLRVAMSGWNGYADKDGAYIDDIDEYFHKVLLGSASAHEPLVAHVDPTGKTREPPHCPTCECGMCGCPDEYCLKRAGTIKPGIRCADDRIKASPCDCGSAVHRKDCSYVR